VPPIALGHALGGRDLRSSSSSTATAIAAPTMAKAAASAMNVVPSMSRDPLEERAGDPEGGERAEPCGSEPATGHVAIIVGAALRRNGPESMAA
jgi:hypothetical protein